MKIYYVSFLLFLFSCNENKNLKISKSSDESTTFYVTEYDSAHNEKFLLRSNVYYDKIEITKDFIEFNHFRGRAFRYRLMDSTIQNKHAAYFFNGECFNNQDGIDTAVAGEIAFSFDKQNDTYNVDIKKYYLDDTILEHTLAVADTVGYRIVEVSSKKETNN